jgi:hypothetical protein
MSSARASRMVIIERARVISSSAVDAGALA